MLAPEGCVPWVRQAICCEGRLSAAAGTRYLRVTPVLHMPSRGGQCVSRAEKAGRGASSRAQRTRAQGSVPFWPSVLSQLTGYTKAGNPPFASAIAHAGRLCSKLYTSADAGFLMHGLM